MTPDAQKIDLISKYTFPHNKKINRVNGIKN